MKKEVYVIALELLLPVVNVFTSEGKGITCTSCQVSSYIHGKKVFFPT